MKKIMALLLVAVFMLSMIPIANADSATANSAVKAQNRQLVQEYNKIKAEYKNSIQNWEISKEEYLKARQDIGTLTSASQETNLIKIRDFLLKTVGRMQSHVEILQKWTEIVIQDEDLKEEILNQLEQDLNELEEYKTEIESTTSIEELREISKELKEFWKETRLHLKKYHGIILSERISNLIEKTEIISESMHNKIDDLDSNNKQVSEMQDLLASFDESIKLAKEDYENARELYIESTTIEQAEDNLEKIKDYTNQAHQHLKEAHKTLVKLVKLYREYTGNFPSPSLNSQIEG